MKVGLLTIEQKNELVGVKLQSDWYFNPIQDADGNWIISTQEMQSNMNPDVIWVKDLPLIEWKSPTYDE
jgi:hypothetical protein